MATRSCTRTPRSSAPRRTTRTSGRRAEFAVSGESGSFNRDEFRKVFSDSKYGDATASGKWTLSAPVPMDRIRELEAVHPKLRAAKTLDEKMKIYSELVKENGARMLAARSA